MNFKNTTKLDSTRLEALLRQFGAAWPLDGLTVSVKYTRSTPFSGTCQYRTGRITINIGRQNEYPFVLKTYIARARSNRRMWWRPLYVIQLQDAYQLALFLFMHELYHWLVKKARRNPRQKESRCDRFAVRALVDGFGLRVRDPRGRAVPREEWDFHDLDGFVAAALRAARRKPADRLVGRSVVGLAPQRAEPPAAQPAGLPIAARDIAPARPQRQLMLFADL